MLYSLLHFGFEPSQSHFQISIGLLNQRDSIINAKNLFVWEELGLRLRCGPFPEGRPVETLNHS